MESWMIGTRLVISLYCFMRYLQGDMESIPLVLLLLLAYISFTVTYYIFKNSLVRRLSRIVSIAILAVAAIVAEPLCLLLISVDILELLSGFSNDWRVYIAGIAVPCALAGEIWLPEYVTFSLLILLIFLLATNHFQSLTVLKKVNDRLRDRNDELLGRLDAGSEYESQMRYLSQIEERNSIAQEIHDRVGHTLAGSIIQLEAAGLILDKDPDKAGNMVRSVTVNLKEGMESIRSTLRTIKPAPEQLGINRLKLILEEFTMNNTIKTSFSYTGSLDVISHLQWKIIIDNIKESLTNTLKFSKATMTNVKLEVMNRLIKVEVIDNGKGAYSIKKGMGLSGMEERTENAGGKLILDGSNGFSVIMLLPAGGANEEAAIPKTANLNITNTNISNTNVMNSSECREGTNAN